jgi:LPS export ABC transporter protein LptC
VKLFSLAFLGIAFALILASCEEKFIPPQTEITADELPSHESWNSTVVFSDSGNVKAVMNAGHIQVYAQKQYTLIDSNATVEFYRNGEHVSTLTGKRGKVDDVTKNIEMFDSVKVVNKEGSTLTTEQLFWDNKTQRVSSDKFVRIITPSETIEGTGFESDQSLKNYTIYKVSGLFSN